MTTLAPAMSTQDHPTSVTHLDAPQAERVVTVIEPRKGWIGIDWGELWRYRELLYFLVWRDLKVKYKMAVLGFAWAIFVPLVSMFIYGGIGGMLGINKGITAPYFVWMLAGLLPWLFIQRNLQDGGMSLVTQQPLLTKIYLPRLFLPASACGSALVDLGISFCLFVVVGVIASLMTGWLPTWQIIFIVPLLVLTIVMALGIALAMSALTVLYRDLRFLVPFTVQFGLWLSAVPYPLTELSPKMQLVYALNPITGIIAGWRSALTGEPWMWPHLATSIVGAVVFIVFGLFYFKRVERRFADIA